MIERIVATDRRMVMAVRRLLGHICVAVLMLPVALFLPTPAQAAPVVPEAGVVLPTTVMTYNIRYAKGGAPAGISKSNFSWDKRGPKVAEWIKFENPDLFGLNENYDLPGSKTNQVTTIVPLLSEYTFLFTDEHNVIGYRTSRYTFIKKGIATLSGSREVVWAYLMDKLTGQTVVHIVTHLAYKQTAAAAQTRAKQVSKLMSLVDSAINPGRKYPFWIMGDFNTLSPNPNGSSTSLLPLERMKSAGMVDPTLTSSQSSVVPKVASYNGGGATVNGKLTAYVIRQTTWRMDYVWVPKDTRVDTWRVATGPDVEWKKVRGRLVPVFGTNVVPSDHNPLVVVIQLPLAGSSGSSTVQLPVSVPRANSKFMKSAV